MDRTGYARGTLATRADLEAPIPALDPAEWLSMADMMGAMGGGMARMTHGAANHSSMSGMSHDSMAGMNHGRLQGMNPPGMSGMKQESLSGIDRKSERLKSSKQCASNNA